MAQARTMVRATPLLGGHIALGTRYTIWGAKPAKIALIAANWRNFSQKR